ncbi:hypothetical protein DI396_15300 [Litorivita pollutaquae]|uniref:Uncharacterized protein n=1 Tax=Litorivita pollutaquae TaxID=2200892 RepID=A0A2V4NK13_9RHOB|nr:hypothetical protein DI396_15300 [Litorivita pollutaquae]
MVLFGGAFWAVKGICGSPREIGMGGATAYMRGSGCNVACEPFQRKDKICVPADAFANPAQRA